jgi:hypothetical protein
MGGSTDDNATLPNATSFFADIEQRAIPSLAWDFSPLSDCHPDLVLRHTTPPTANAWGRRFETTSWPTPPERSGSRLFFSAGPAPTVGGVGGDR